MNMTLSPRPTSVAPPPEAAPARSRMASVQDNVRSLLRASIHSATPSVASSHRIPKLRIAVPGLPSRFRPQSSDNETTRAGSVHRVSDSSEQYAAPTPSQEVSPITAPIPPAPAYRTRIVTPHDPHLQEFEEEQDTHSITALVQHRTKRRQQRAWKRRRGGSNRHHRASHKRNPRTRILGQAVLVSGLVLLAVLALCTSPNLTRTLLFQIRGLIQTYLTDLSLALTRPDLGSEIHVLFILVILTITVFFAHSLIRLCLACSSRSRRSRHHHHGSSRRIPSMTGPEGFRPDTPIRVHLQRDEELGPASEFDTSPEIPSPETPGDNRTFDGLLQKETSTRIEGPPPAYGLWRSSVVRVFAPPVFFNYLLHGTEN